jgi:hypothetical protein
MMPQVRERLWLRHLLPIRSDLARRGSFALQLPIGLLPLLHLAVDQGRNVLCSGLSASKARLQSIRCQLSFLHTVDPEVL